MVLACICATLVLVFTYHHGGMRRVPHSMSRHFVFKEHGGSYRIPKGRPLSVNLVVAAMSTEDYSWVEQLRVPGLVIVPYIADNISAPHHPQKNKGHESMIYHQYFYDFYDNLPDVSILVHSGQKSWHVDSLLEQDSQSISSSYLFQIPLVNGVAGPFCVDSLPRLSTPNSGLY